MENPKIQLISCDKHCPPQLRRAVGDFNSGLSVSFTRASKSNRFSIWHHAQQTIGSSVTEILGSERWSGIAPGGFAICGRKEPQAMADRCRVVARLLSRSLTIEYDAKKDKIFHTLEFLISLIAYCGSIHPLTYSTTIEDGDGFLYSRRLKLRTNLPHSPYCELCDQLSEKLEEIRSRETTKYDEKESASSRFCKVHRPGSAEYRRAHNYREAFHQKIEQLSRALREGSQIEGIDEVRRLLEKDETIRGSYSIDLHHASVTLNKKEDKRVGGNSSEYKLKSFVFASDEVIRRVAYQLVHPDPSKTRSKTTGRKEVVLTHLELAQTQGKSISMAARELGISRQAAWKALNN